MSDFFPKDYEVPQKSGNYFKFQDGQNKFRILDNPIMGWVGWKEGNDGTRKPVRKTMDEKFPMNEVDDESQIKHFVAMPVWNYKEEKIQILEITQKGIQRSLRALERSEGWGNPTGYDIVVTKTGQKLETEYTVMPEPPKPIDKGLTQLYKDMHIDLSALYRGDDPFKNEEIKSEDIPDL